MGEPLASARLKKEKWVAALRSGEYQQNRGGWSNGSLNPTAFCCLGVAGCVTGHDYASYAEVMEELDMSNAVQDDLVKMNDRLGKSFDEIAAWIETHDLKTGTLLQAEHSEGGTP